jgi:hypothetical protein
MIIVTLVAPPQLHTSNILRLIKTGNERYTLLQRPQLPTTGTLQRSLLSSIAVPKVMEYVQYIHMLPSGINSTVSLLAAMYQTDPVLGGPPSLQTLIILGLGVLVGSVVMVSKQYLYVHAKSTAFMAKKKHPRKVAAGFEGACACYLQGITGFGTAILHLSIWAIAGALGFDSGSAH